MNEQDLLTLLARCICDIKYERSLDLHVSIDFTDDKSVQGLWNNDKNTILIQRKWSLEQIKNGRWIAIDAVIRHEMAHAIVDQILIPNNQLSDKAHGSLFRHACSMVGYNPTTDTVKETDAECRLRMRIEKLLNLGTSTNEHEASLAIQKAHELMIRHSVKELMSDDSQFYVEIPRMSFFTQTRRPSPIYLLNNFCLNQFPTVQSIWTQEQRLMESEIHPIFAGKICHYRCLEFMGPKSLVEQVAYTFDFLFKVGTDLYNTYKKINLEKGNDSFGHQKSWWRGFLSGIEMDLNKVTKDLQKEGLVLTADSRLAEAFKARYPKTIGLGSFTYSHHSEAHTAGKSAGNKTKISKGIVSRSENKTTLLT